MAALIGECSPSHLLTVVASHHCSLPFAGYLGAQAGARAPRAYVIADGYLLTHLGHLGVDGEHLEDRMDALGWTRLETVGDINWFKFIAPL
eukprot:SAG11_NODE_20026_length_454_cov_0.954930_2_plen_90_part_01